MPIFETVTFTYRGQSYTIPDALVMKTIARVEDVLTLAQIHYAIENKSLPLAKIATAFGIMLRAAGGREQYEENDKA